MGFWKSVKKQLRSVIEWENTAGDDLYFKWSENGDEIKDASKLILGPGQGVILVYEGRLIGTHTDEGILELQTANVPFVTTLKKYMQAFESEHKVGIYFFKTTKMLDLKWGTPSPIKYADPKYNFPIELRAFGNFSMRLDQPENFFVNVIGKGGSVKVDDIRQMLLSRLVQPLTDYFAESKLSYAEIDANKDEMAAGIQGKVAPEFERLGFQLLDFRVTGTNFDEETKKRIGRIADLTAEAMAAKVAGVNYADLQKLEAMKTAAANEGGIAGMGVGMGAGIGLGQMMGAGMAGNQQQNNSSAAPSSDDPMEKLKKLKQMFEAGLITQEEYDGKKAEILAKM